MKNILTPPHEPLCVNVKDAAKMLGICERTLNTLIKDREIPVVRIGRRVLLRKEDLEAFVHSHTDKQKESSIEQHVIQRLLLKFREHYRSWEQEENNINLIQGQKIWQLYTLKK